MILPCTSSTWLCWNRSHHVVLHPGQVQPTTGGLQRVRVAARPPRRTSSPARCGPATAGSPPAAASAAGSGSRRTERPRARVEQAAVDVEHDRLGVRQQRRHRPLDEQPVRRAGSAGRSAGPSAPCSAAAAANRSRPTPTAAATGSARVATKVTTIAILPVWLVFQTTAMSPDRSGHHRREDQHRGQRRHRHQPDQPATARPGSPASRCPPKIDAHRLRAPAATLSAVLLTEPPTGVPWKNPDARLATPWPMKSRLVLDGDPSGFGAASATPAPCTRAIAAIAKRAGDHADGQVRQVRQHQRREPAGDRADVGHRRHVGQPHQRDDDGRHARPRSATRTAPNLVRLEQEHHRQRGYPDDGRRGDRCPDGWVMT